MRSRIMLRVLSRLTGRACRRTNGESVIAIGAPRSACRHAQFTPGIGGFLEYCGRYPSAREVTASTTLTWAPRFKTLGWPRLGELLLSMEGRDNNVGTHSWIVRTRI